MPATMYYDQDADLGLLKGKTIAIIGYGSQGHAQAQNLRDSGCNVVVGQRPGSANYDAAVKDGFKPVSAAEAAEQGDLVNILLPDEVQADIYARDIKPHLKPGNLLLCSHGFNIHFGQVVPPEGVDAALVAPKGPGHLVRSEFVARRRRPLPDRLRRRLLRARQEARPRLRQGDRRHPRRRLPDHLRRGDRDRPLRRAGRPLRRRQRPGQDGLRDACSRPATSRRAPTSSACTS